MNCKAKGSRAEYKSIRLLEKEGYKCIRAAASLGVFDIAAFGLFDVILVQVKSNDWPGSEEMERIRQFPTPPGVRRIIHRWRDRQPMPDAREIALESRENGGTE